MANENKKNMAKTDDGNLNEVRAKAYIQQLNDSHPKTDAKKATAAYRTYKRACRLYDVSF